MVIGDEHKNDNREKSRRRDWECGATPQVNQVPSYVQATTNDQVPVNPPAMMDGEVRAALFQMAHAITTQA